VKFYFVFHSYIHSALELQRCQLRSANTRFVKFAATEDQFFWFVLREKATRKELRMVYLK